MSSVRPSFCMLLLFFMLAACSSPPPIHTAKAVDLERFMGDWYVIANIPTFIETDAYNAMESYRLDQDGTVATTFSFRAGGFEGERKTYHPTGYIIDKQSNAAYEQTIIGRLQRDYVWLMARTPQVSEADYQRFLNIIAEEGYDVSKVRRVPQRWN
ncbi:MAG: Outer rane lipoprotein [Nitrospira sp.]|nr:Outer rane lipoprotein [Nitrospira sp.]